MPCRQRQSVRRYLRIQMYATGLYNRRDAAAAAAAVLPAAPAAAAAAASGGDLRARLERLVNYAPVMLFMKGTPDAPRCGFSRQMVELLRSVGAKFSSFDILTDESVRQGLKEYSNWPTYPQLYVKGKLIGGLDIARELHEQGELQQTLSGVQSANQ